jgi:alkylation response protein AidB-like acyl-CoA dehydrogenase
VYDGVAAMSAATSTPFTDEHQQLRESIRAFVTREVAPHVEAWERDTFPDAIVKRMGELEAARRLIYATATDYAAGADNVREISMAKLKATQVAWMVADTCVQIHGGAGYMREYPIERVMRDLRLYRIGAGADEIMLDVIGKCYGL